VALGGESGGRTGFYQVMAVVWVRTPRESHSMLEVGWRGGGQGIREVSARPRRIVRNHLEPGLSVATVNGGGDNIVTCCCELAIGGNG